MLYDDTITITNLVSQVISQILEWQLLLHAYQQRGLQADLVVCLSFSISLLQSDDSSPRYVAGSRSVTAIDNK
jgi:hypothetical protein